MAYAITHGTDPAVPAQRRETATAALELIKLLQAEKKPNIKITDRTGAVLTVPDLEELSGKENILPMPTRSFAPCASPRPFSTRNVLEPAA